MDLQDREHNTRDGVHMASLAGAWIALVDGFGGMRSTAEGAVSFAPCLPGGLTRLAFNLWLRGCRLKVTITSKGVRYELMEGPKLEIAHDKEPLALEVGTAVERPLLTRQPHLRPVQPAGREPRRL
jgi:alpha,alpha-trehalose phosphorylase